MFERSLGIVSAYQDAFLVDESISDISENGKGKGSHSFGHLFPDFEPTGK